VIIAVYLLGRGIVILYSRWMQRRGRGGPDDGGGGGRGGGGGGRGGRSDELVLAA
jgi:hypothetical protein